LEGAAYRRRSAALPNNSFHNLQSLAAWSVMALSAIVTGMILNPLDIRHEDIDNE
jgi:hypothetical protein